MIISTYVGKVADKMQYPFIIKILIKKAWRGIFPNLFKNIYKKVQLTS